MNSLEAKLSVERMVRFDGEGSLKAFCDLAIGEMLLQTSPFAARSA